MNAASKYHPTKGRLTETCQHVLVQIWCCAISGPSPKQHDHEKSGISIDSGYGGSLNSAAEDRRENFQSQFRRRQEQWDKSIKAQEGGLRAMCFDYNCF